MNKTKFAVGVLTLVFYVAVQGTGFSQETNDKQPQDIKPGTRYILNPADPPNQGPPQRITLRNDIAGGFVSGTPGASYKMLMSFDPISGALQPNIHADGCEHVWLGNATLGAGKIQSAADYPLTFKWKKGVGYVYLCGKGELLFSGKHVRLGYEDTTAIQIKRLKSEDQFEREGAAEAIGWLAKTSEDVGKGVPSLIEALKDTAMEVRRDCAEALGRIGDSRAAKELNMLTEPEKENELWVRDVAAEALGLIKIKTVSQKIPDKSAIAVATEALTNKFPLVRETAAKLLANGGSEVIDPLIPLLKDEVASVRATTAGTLASLNDKRAVEAVRKALLDEKDSDAKKAMEKALARPGK